MKTILSILGSIVTIWEKDMESRNGKISLYIRDIGLIIKQMEEVALYILMETSMLDSGRMIRHMGMDNICIKMGLNMLVSGSKMLSMDMVKSIG